MTEAKNAVNMASKGLDSGPALKGLGAAGTCKAMKPVLLTSHWRAVYDHAKALGEGEAPGYLPVRISKGGPRYWPAAKAFPAIDELMPDGWMFKIDTSTPEGMDKFMRSYRRKLHTVGLEPIRAKLQQLTDEYHRPIVLLCFEGDSQGCHRGSNGGFAAWWQAKTGEEVPEAEDLGVLRPFET